MWVIPYKHLCKKHLPEINNIQKEAELEFRPYQDIIPINTAEDEEAIITIYKHTVAPSFSYKTLCLDVWKA